MRRNRISSARNSSLVFDPSAIRICQINENLTVLTLIMNDKVVIENNKENNVAKVVKQDNIKVTEIRSISWFEKLTIRIIWKTLSEKMRKYDVIFYKN